MKFEYDGADQDRECVAFIDDVGDLWIRDRHGSENVCISKIGEVIYAEGDFFIEGAVKKFYPGDKITITF